MRKKILFTSHTANFAKFNVPFMRALKQQGHEIHYASAGEEPVPECDRHFTVPFERSPLKPANYQAYKQLKKIIDEQNYDLIHTHTPMGSVVTRLAARTARTRGTKIIYTAHGFHFFKGAPLLNWLIYYPVEKTLARHADALVTINQEDFNRARNKFKTNVYYLPGTGVDLKKFQPTDSAKREALRKQYGYSPEDFILICIAELNANKNQAFLINHIYPLLLEIPTIKLLLCGTGDTAKQYEQLVTELNMHEQIQFLGYRNDVHNLLALSDVAVSSSKREGLGINLIEAMAVGLPLVASSNRGHRDVIDHSVHGYLYNDNDTNAFKEYVLALHTNQTLVQQIRKNNTVSSDKYSLTNAIKAMMPIYAEHIFTHQQQPIAEELFNISVVVPAYNASVTITRTLDSISNQTALGLIGEIIVVDDGSTDNTADIVASYSKKFDKNPTIKLITTQNKGASNARNVGLKAATGNWIALLDADDYWALDKIQKQTAAIMRHPSIKFIGTNSSKRILHHGTKLSDGVYKINLHQYLFKTFPSTCSVLFEKKILDITGYFDVQQSHAEDANLFMRMIHRYDGHYLAEPLLHLNEKPTFGHTGLSGDLRAMHKGSLKNIANAHKLGYITLPKRTVLVAWEFIRYARRIVITKARAVKNKPQA